MNFPIAFPAGLSRKGTEYDSRGRWYDANLVRWVDNVIQPVGGWRPFGEVLPITAVTGNPITNMVLRSGVGPMQSPSAIVLHAFAPLGGGGGGPTSSAPTVDGAGRSIIAWGSGALAKLIAIGTSSYLYVMASDGTLTDITPARASGTLGTDPFSVASGSTEAIVTDTGHGLTVGDTVSFSGATEGGGITIDGAYVVTAVDDADTYRIEHSEPATSIDTTTGGAAVAYAYEISPGLDDSSATGGYGYGLYGAGTYGTPFAGYGITTEARVWSLDTFGQYLIAAPGQWGDIYEWQLDPAVRAAKIANSPTALAMVVTDEAFVFALGAGGNPRNVAWCDQGNNTLWTPAATNQAGDKDLQTFGKLVCGRKAKGCTLLFTDMDVHRATFVGGTNIYAFERAGDGCGIISKGAVGAVDNVVVWMGQKSFWIYDGYVRPLPCDLMEYIFTDLNDLQRAKVSCQYDSGYGEFTWYYPSLSATENDRYVRWHSREPGNVWTKGDLSRLSGCDRGVFLSPFAVGPDGYIYEHEVGWDYDDVGAVEDAAAFIESGPMELPLEMGGSDHTANVRDYVPDEKTSGEITLTIKIRNFPNSAEVDYGPFLAANPRNLRLSGRQFKVRFEGATRGPWRVGTPKFDVTRGGKR